MNKSKNNPKDGEDQAQSDSKTPPGACGAKDLAPNIKSILGEIQKINGVIDGVKGELATLAAKPDVDLSSIQTLITAVDTGFASISKDVQALVEAQASLARKDDLSDLADKSDIDQVKQMLSGLALGMGEVRAGVSGLHGKVDVIGADTAEIKAGVLSIEQKIDLLTEGMGLVIGDLHAIRAGVNALEHSLDSLGDAVVDIKEDTKFIPEMNDDLKTFRIVFDATAKLIIQTISGGNSALMKKVEAHNQNVNKLAASVSQASKHIVGLSDSAGQIISDINQISIKARGAVNMSEAALRSFFEVGTQAAGEELLERVKGWISPLIDGMKASCSEEAFVVMAGSIATSSEKIAAGVQSLNDHADDIPRAVSDLKETLQTLVSAKAISHEEFLSRTEELESTYKKIAGHLAGVASKSDQAVASIKNFETSSAAVVEKMSRTATTGMINTLEARMDGMEDRLIEKVVERIKPALAPAFSEVVSSLFVAAQDASITP